MMERDKSLFHDKAVGEWGRGSSGMQVHTFNIHCYVDYES
jgi:hypothetical protein